MTTVLYLLMIVGVNFGFAHTIPFDTSLGPLPPMSFVVGAIFVMRDFVQRKIGHKVLLVMLIGCIISYWMASPMVATASLFAFLLAEISDWAIYSLLPLRFQYRVLYSSMVGVLVDTAAFLPMIGMFSWPAVVIMWGSKMIAALAVFAWYRVKA